MDENEKNVLDAGPVWQFEKIAWYANSTPYSGDIPIYRLYSDGLKQHLYTADVNEKNTLDGNGVWVYEGIAYYTLAASTSEPTPTPVSKMQLTAVRNWAYNIQHVDTSRQREELVGTHFDMYVLELAVTETGKENFDIAALIRDIRQYNISTRNVDPLILAYVDVGQAEEWRWYFGAGWGIGNPEWIAGNDPDNWAGNFPVAYWYADWQNIVIYGYNGRSMVEETLKAGFDGIYMDWVEAFSDVNVTAKAQADEIDPAAAMFDFIGNIRTYARQSSPNANPGYLVIAQNASDLYQENPGRYNSIIDAIALEAIWYDGDGGFDNWDDPSGYNVLTNAINPGWTEEVLSHLQPMKAYMPIFCVEYAQDMNGLLLASDIYNTKAPAEGFIPYCSRRSLSRLSTTPYPSGYSPIDY
jgi:cysteinyl-tRNA synthetase